MGGLPAGSGVRCESMLSLNHSPSLTRAAPLQASVPILKLQTLNPYVEYNLKDWRENQNLVPVAAREVAPLLLPSSSQLSGTSSFGMSGVNAHALLSAAPGRSQADGSPLPVLHRLRHWVLAPAYHLAGRPYPSLSSRGLGSTCSLVANLASPELSYLWDHKVQTSVVV